MSSGKPLVSVIIPVFNRPHLLREALASVQAQHVEGFSFEIIVVDDGSDPGQRPVVEDQSVRLIRQDHTGFPGQARNRGVRASRGKWLAFLDSDDLWQPDKLARQLTLHRICPELSLSHTREEWNRGGRIISQKKFTHRRQGNLFPDALEKCIIGPSTVMIHRDLYEKTGGFREDLEVAEDYEYWLRLTNSQSVGYVDEPLTVKRAGLESQAQLSEKYGQIEIFRIQGLQDLVEAHVFSQENQSLAEKALASKALIYARGCTKRGRHNEAAKYEKLAAKWGG